MKGSASPKLFTSLNYFNLVLLAIYLTVHGCGNNKPTEGSGKTNAPAILQSKDQFYEFQKSLQIKSIDTVAVKVNDLITKAIGKDTDITSFSFSGIKFKYVSYQVNECCHEDCEEGQTRYYFVVNGNVVRSKAIPDSLRNDGFELEPFCSLTLQPEKARKIDLNGATYLIIPSERGDCTGEFCSMELDHLFEIKNNKVTYLTVDGWQLCDINNDGHIDQIVYNERAIGYFAKLLKKERKIQRTIRLIVMSIWKYGP